MFFGSSQSEICSWRFLDQAIFTREIDQLYAQPQPGGPGYSSSSGNSPQTCPAWVTLPFAKLHRYSPVNHSYTPAHSPRHGGSIIESGHINVPTC
ncbi:hypothetical protein CEXT_498391 [Caerostris extrusa]|uniref:Uncharacterized protein n=1 Tax=Caerostris extrusa TaxID=172846 RepID=A0AAV4TFQ3_CAEEX|nr:hypothetical protein CEXT_498391 [Caerostris extrusa]